MSIRKAVIPAAGLGTRFLPASKALPKEMLPIVDKPTLQYIVEEAVEAGIKDILIIIARNKESIANHFDKSPEVEIELERRGELELLAEIKRISSMVNIQYVRQIEPLGLGHAIACAKTFVGDEAFAILLGDDVVYSEEPCIGQMIEVYEKYKTSVIGVRKVDKEDIDKYGNLKGELVEEGVYRVEELIEKPKPEEVYSNIGVLGRHVVTPGIFKVLEEIEPGKDGEIQLTDAFNILAKLEDMYAYEFRGRRYDLGSKQGFLEANIEYALRDEELRDNLLKYLKRIIF